MTATAATTAGITRNYVVSAGQAMVRGTLTGLAGCSNADCPLRESCLRADVRLTLLRPDHNPAPGTAPCWAYISNREED